jgi:hypothetical protein
MEVDAKMAMGCVLWPIRMALVQLLACARAAVVSREPAMALLNRQLTKEELSEILDKMPLMIEYDSFYKGLFEPRHQYVRYDAAMGRIVYEDQETFYWCTDESPSDSRWMVPHATASPIDGRQN